MPPDVYAFTPVLLAVKDTELIHLGLKHIRLDLLKGSIKAILLLLVEEDRQVNLMEHLSRLSLIREAFNNHSFKVITLDSSTSFHLHSAISMQTKKIEE